MSFGSSGVHTVHCTFIVGWPWPVASMRVHRAELSEAIKDGAAWLG